MPATLYLPDGTQVVCKTEDFSMRGMGLHVTLPVSLARGDRVRVSLESEDREYQFPFEVALVRDQHVGLLLGELSIPEERDYVRCTFGSPDAWNDWDRNVSADHPLASFAEVFSFGATGYVRLFQSVYNELVSRLRGHSASAAA
jgi:cellulose synthase (UDP-forming)